MIMYFLMRLNPNQMFVLARVEMRHWVLFSHSITKSFYVSIKKKKKGQCRKSNILYLLMNH